MTILDEIKRFYHKFKESFEFSQDYEKLIAQLPNKDLVDQYYYDFVKNEFIPKGQMGIESIPSGSIKNIDINIDNKVKSENIGVFFKNDIAINDTWLEYALLKNNKVIYNRFRIIAMGTDFTIRITIYAYLLDGKTLYPIYIYDFSHATSINEVIEFPAYNKLGIAIYNLPASSSKVHFEGFLFFSNSISPISPYWTFADASSIMYQKSTLIDDTNWNNIQLANIVHGAPDGSNEVIIRVYGIDNVAGSLIQFRKDGNANVFSVQVLTTQVANVPKEKTVMLPLISNIAEINIVPKPTDWTLIYIYLVAYR